MLEKKGIGVNLYPFFSLQILSVRLENMSRWFAYAKVKQKIRLTREEIKEKFAICQQICFVASTRWSKLKISVLRQTYYLVLMTF